MKKITYVFIIITIMLFLGSGFTQRPLLANTEDKIESNEDILLNITTVSKNQYYMVKSIVLDKHNVEYLSDNESEVYEFEYSEGIVNNISGRDLFIYYGANNEKWVDEFIGDLKKGNLGIINMSRGIKTLIYENDGREVENPNYWLGVNEYKIALYNIKSAIQEKDPKNKEYYEENYINAINEMEKTIKEAKLELEKYKNYTILTDTNAFDYLLKDLGLPFVKVNDDIVTRRVIKENKLDENKVIFIKEKKSILKSETFESEREFNNLKEVKKLEKEKLNPEELELEESVQVKEIELVRWDSEKTLVEVGLSNIKWIIDGLKLLPIEEE